MARKQSFLVCPPLEIMARKQSFLVCPPLEIMARKQISCRKLNQKSSLETVTAQRELAKWRDSRAQQLEEDRKYCHPRWQQEEKYLNAEIGAVKNLSLVSTSDWWIYFDWVCLFLILATIVTTILFFKFGDEVMLWNPFYTYLR